MMLSVEEFEDFCLKGKSKQEIQSLVSQLLREMQELKDKIQAPDYELQLHMKPDERTILAMDEDYLAAARSVLESAGGSFPRLAAKPDPEE